MSYKITNSVFCIRLYVFCLILLCSTISYNKSFAAFPDCVGGATGSQTISTDISLGGTWVITGNFTVNAGVTVTVCPGNPLIIIASGNIVINGTINGDGAGYAGGAGGAPGGCWREGGSSDCGGIAGCVSKDNCRQLRTLGGSPGGAGSGPGGGLAGTAGLPGEGSKQECEWWDDKGGKVAGAGGGGGGSGGCYGGAGGNSVAGGGYGGRADNCGDPATCFAIDQGYPGVPGAACSTYGTVSGTDGDMGSGGSGAGGGGRGRYAGSPGGNGGAGGGYIKLKATGNITIAGTVSANGATGGVGGAGGDGGYSPRCCADLSNNCDERTYTGGGGGGIGGGGGSGGAIIIEIGGCSSTVSITGTLRARGGAGGTGGVGGAASSNADAGDASGNGNGGGGGRIKIFSNNHPFGVLAGITGGIPNGQTGSFAAVSPTDPSINPGTISANQTICNTTPALLTGTDAMVFGCSYYEWWHYTVGGTPVLIPSSDVRDYQPPVLSETHSYFRKICCGGAIASSNTITVTVNGGGSGGEIIPNDPYSTNIGDPYYIDQCQGYDPVATTDVISPTGIGYVIQWEQSVGCTGIWVPASGTNNGLTYDPGVLGSSNICYRRRSDVISGGCTTSSYASGTGGTLGILHYRAAVDPGSIYDQLGALIVYNCSSSSSFTVLQNTFPTGGSNSYNYRWQSSLDNSSFTNISDGANITGATTGSVTYPNGMGFTGQALFFLRLSVSCAGGSTWWYTNSVRIMQIPNLLVANSITAVTPVCSPSSQLITGSASIPDPDFTYQWYVKDNFGAYIAIAGATGQNYATPLLTANAEYKRDIIYSGAATCPSWVVPGAATLIQVTDPFTSPGTIGSNQTLCYGTAPGNPTFTETVAPVPNSGGSYLWEYSIDNGVVWSAAPGTNNLSSYTYFANVTDTLYFKRTLSSGGCDAPSNEWVTLTPAPQIIGGRIISDQSVCSGGDPALFTVPTLGISSVTSAGPMITVTTSAAHGLSSGNAAEISGITGFTTTPAGLINGTYGIRVNDATSFSYIAPITAISGSHDAATGILTFNPTGGTGSSWTYDWEYTTAVGCAGGWTSLGVDALTYDPPPGIVATTCYRRKAINNCNPAIEVYSNNATVTVNPNPAITNMTGAGCSGSLFTVTPANVTNGVVPAGTTYSWAVPVVTGGLTGGASGSGAADISGTLTNPTTAAETATYTVTPTSGAGCIGATFEVEVTINPSPVINDLTTTTCSSGGFTVTPVNVTDGLVPPGTTYSWALPIVTGGLTGGATGSGAASITGSLINPTNTPQTATYTVTPTDGTGCSGATFEVEVTINPEPAISNMTGTGCSGVMFTVTPVNGVNGIVPAGTTYSWAAPVVTGGMTGGTSASGASITGTLTNPTNASQTATYTVTSILASGCTAPDFTVTLTVEGIAIQPADVSVCVPPGDATFSVTSTGIPSSYQWQVNSGGGFANQADGGIYSGMTTSTMSITGGNVGMNANEYRVIVTGGGCSVVSNPATYYVTSITGDPADRSVCEGGSTSFTVTAPGISNYVWQVDDQLGGGFVDIVAAGTGPVYSDYTLGTLQLTGIVIANSGYQYRAIPASCGATLPATLTVTPTFNPGAITFAGTEPLCNGTILNANPSGGSGSYLYQWQTSTSCVGAFTNVGGNVSSIAASTGATVTYYRVIVDDIGVPDCGPPTPSSNCASVVATFNPGTILAGQTICPGDDIGNITEVTAPTGGSGTYSYIWQSSNAAPVIFGATLATTPSYDPPTTTASPVWYRRRVTDDVCGSAANSTPNHYVSMAPPGTLDGGTVTDNQSICNGFSPAPLVQVVAPSGGNGSYTYLWESFNGTLWVPAGGTNDGVSYQPPLLTTTTQYRRQVFSCSDNDISNFGGSLTMTVHPAMNPGSITGNQTICPTGDPAAFTGAPATGGTGAHVYNWQSSTDGGFSWTSLPSPNIENYDLTAGSVTQSTSYRRAYSNGCTPIVYSNTINITTLETAVAGTLTAETPICMNGYSSIYVTGVGTITLQESATGGVGTWDDFITGGTNPFRVGPLTVSTYYRAKLEKNNCDSAFTAPFLVTVSPTVNAWLGTVSTDWHDKRNWGCGGVPNSRTDVTISKNATDLGIGTVVRQPVISNDPTSPSAWYNYIAPCKTFKLYPLATLGINPGAILCVDKDGRGECAPTICGPDTMICASQSIQLLGDGGTNDAADYPGPPYPFEWTVVSGDAGSLTTPYVHSPVVNPTVTTVYKLTTWDNRYGITSDSLVTVTVGGLTPGATNAVDQLKCSGSPADLLADVTPASGIGTISIKWQQNPGCNTSWGDASTTLGSNSNPTYQPPDVTAKVCYRRSATNGVCDPVYTNVVTVDLASTATAGTIGSNQTLAPSTHPAYTITEVTPSDGNPGLITYAWWKSSDDVSYASIPGATSSTYTIPASSLSGDTWYQRRVTYCSATSVSNTVKMTMAVSAATCYNSGNEAYWAEKDLGYNNVKIGPPGCATSTIEYVYDATNHVYKGTSGGFTWILIPDLNTSDDGNKYKDTDLPGYPGSGVGPSISFFQFDNNSNYGGVYDRTKMFISDVQAQTQNYCQVLENGSGVACDGGSSATNIDNNPTWAYPALSPTGGSPYNVWTGDEQGNAGTIIPGGASYISQQNLINPGNQSYCQATYGNGWRLPTDIEMGHTDHSAGVSAWDASYDDEYGGYIMLFSSSRASLAESRWYLDTSIGEWFDVTVDKVYDPDNGYISTPDGFFDEIYLVPRCVYYSP